MDFPSRTIQEGTFLDAYDSDAEIPQSVTISRHVSRYGEGVDRTGSALNRVKKDADAISAYAMSESLWYASRSLPENHAIMVCMGEGLMPKSGETDDMGSNPQLGFGRVYADLPPTGRG